MTIELPIKTQYKESKTDSETIKALRRFTRLRTDFVAEQSRWVSRARGLINQMFPELEALLGDLTTGTTLKLLEAYPARQALPSAPTRDAVDTACGNHQP